MPSAGGGQRLLLGEGQREYETLQRLLGADRLGATGAKASIRVRNSRGKRGAESRRGLCARAAEGPRDRLSRL